MNFIKKNWGKLLLVSYSFFIPVISLAQITVEPCDTSGKLCNPLAKAGIQSIPDLIKTFLEGALKIGIPIIALAIIYSGFLFVKAQGKPEEINHAKDTLLYTLIGGAILLGAWAIAQMISATVLAL